MVLLGQQPAKPRTPLIQHKHIVIYMNEGSEDHLVDVNTVNLADEVRKMAEQEGVTLAYVRKHVMVRNKEYKPHPGEPFGPTCRVAGTQLRAELLA